MTVASLKRTSFLFHQAENQACEESKGDRALKWFPSAVAAVQSSAAGRRLWRAAAGAAWGPVHPVGDGVVKNGVVVATLTFTVRGRGAVVQAAAHAGEQGSQSARAWELWAFLLRFNESAVVCRRREEIQTAGARLRGQAQVGPAASAAVSIFISSFSVWRVPALQCVRLW